MPRKILIVDDDSDFVREFIDTFDDYEFAAASNGAEAIHILKKPNEIDLVILDVNMPGAKGTEVLKEMKAIAPDLGIIILTGYSSENVAIDALKGHADEYIEKPFDIDEMRLAIESLLDAGSGPEGAQGIVNKVEKVKAFVERNCYKKVCLKDAAEAVSLSPKYLSRIFKENTGMGFSEFRLGVKTREARKLLKETGLNIDQISYKLGYQNTESFTRVFKDISGQTPTEFRKKNLTNRNNRHTDNKSAGNGRYRHK